MNKKILIPESLRKAAAEATGGVDPEGYTLYHPLAAAVQWLENAIHPSNVDFHRAVLEAEAKRYPGNDQDTNVIMMRVAFEYGVCFARNYILELFTEKQPELKKAEVEQIIERRMQEYSDWMIASFDALVAGRQPPPRLSWDTKRKPTTYGDLKERK